MSAAICWGSDHGSTKDLDQSSIESFQKFVSDLWGAVLTDMNSQGSDSCDSLVDEIVEYGQQVGSDQLSAEEGHLLAIQIAKNAFILQELKKKDAKTTKT